MPEKKNKQTAKKKPVLRGEHGREVQRQHLWKFGEHPSDPDADPESGWTYLNLKPPESDRTIKTTREMLAGGVPSGMPCTCGSMTQWVQTVSALKMLEEGGYTFDNARREEFKNAQVAILICPRCEAVTQMQYDVAKAIRERYVNNS